MQRSFIGFVILLLVFLPIVSSTPSAPNPPSISLDFSAVAWFRSFISYQGNNNITDLGTYLWKNNFDLNAVLLIGTPFDRAVNTSSNESGEDIIIIWYFLIQQPLASIQRPKCAIQRMDVLKDNVALSPKMAVVHALLRLSSRGCSLFTTTPH